MYPLGTAMNKIFFKLVTFIYENTVYSIIPSRLVSLIH